MQFKEVNPNHLPEYDVLAYSPTSGVTTGKIMYNPVIDSVICSGGVKSVDNVTHYIPLDEIKPSEPKPSLLDALPNDWIICKSDNRLEIYRSFRDVEDGLIYDEQRRPESIKDFEERIIDDFV